MSKKHLSDVLFDYLLGSLHISFSDEETDRILKTAAEDRNLKTEDALSETNKE